MNEEGFGDDFINNINWATYNNNTMSQEEVDKLVAPIQRFFLAKTAKELYEAAIEKVLMIAPVYNPPQQLADRHLQARKFFVPIEHPELKKSFVYPRTFVQSQDALVGVRRRAPQLGEHNLEIFEGELGLKREQLISLKEAGVI
jgi:formyl-CoA transferase